GEQSMKIHTLLIVPAVIVVTCAAALAQGSSEIDSHVAAGKAAAGLNFRDTFVNLCLPAAAPGGARGGGPGGTPDRSVWYASPYKVFDNLYWLGTRQHSSWALTTSAGIIVID